MFEIFGTFNKFCGLHLFVCLCMYFCLSHVEFKHWIVFLDLLFGYPDIGDRPS
jgi:hypothetical protein